MKTKNNRTSESREQGNPKLDGSNIRATEAPETKESRKKKGDNHKTGQNNPEKEDELSKIFSLIYQFIDNYRGRSYS